MYPHRSATKLRAIEDQVIGPRQQTFWISLQLVGIIDPGGCTRMVQSIVATVCFVILEHGEIHYPQRLPLLSNELEIMTQAHSQGTQCFADDFALVGTEEDQVAICRRRALQNAGYRGIGKKLQDGRL